MSSKTASGAQGERQLTVPLRDNLGPLQYKLTDAPPVRQLVSGGGRPSWLLITVTASSTGSLAASSRC